MFHQTAIKAWQMGGINLKILPTIFTFHSTCVLYTTNDKRSFHYVYFQKKKGFHYIWYVSQADLSLSLSLSLSHTPPLSKLTPRCDLLRKIIVCFQFFFCFFFEKIVCFQIDFELTLSFVSLFYICNLEVTDKMTSSYIK